MSESTRTAAKKPEASKNVNLVSKARKVDFSHSVNSSVNQIFFLQRTIGNQAVQRLFKAGIIQAKLKISQPNDIYEQEADRMADQVMRMPGPLALTDSRALPVSRGSQVGYPTTSDHATQVQLKCSCGGTCDRCKAEQTDEEHGAVQRKPEARPQIAADGSSTATTAMNASPIMHEVLRSSGQRLDTATRAFFEPRFGVDFSQVRIHTGAAAGDLADSVQARSFTVGGDIFFGRGHYTPGTSEGKRLLAHELTHVVHQTVAGQTKPVRIAQRTECAMVQGFWVTKEPAGGCGICYGVINPKKPAAAAGTAAHAVIERAYRMRLAHLGKLIEFPFSSPTDDNGRLDIVLATPTGLKIGEIKPANPEGEKQGIQDLDWYKMQLQMTYPKSTIEMLDVRLPLGAGLPMPDPIASFSGCPPQVLSAVPMRLGLYGYFCVPPFSAARRLCLCKGKREEEQKEREQKEKETGPPDTLTGKLLKLGGEFAALLAADELLSAALSFVGSLAVALSPLLALAALALGIVFLWDKIKRVAQTIASVAKWVWDKFSLVVSTILDTIKEIGIKIGELAVWAGGLIKQFAEKIAEGLLWVGRRVLAGAKWVGGKIASAAEAIWDWLTGSGPEAEAPVIDLPVTEEPTLRCGTVAHEDALVTIGADLLFNTAEWKLKPEAETSLKEAAAKVLSMLRNSNDPVRIEGYTDNVGGFEYNQHLSEQRAGAVADWFVQHGVIPMSKIKITGFGKTRAQYNDTEGRKKDRRVEIWVTKHGSTEKVCW